MPKWIVYALLSMVFAGVTSVIAKLGLTGISADLGLALRTCFVFATVMLFAAVAVPHAELHALNSRNWYWLGLSGLTAAVSWIFYYRAIKLGEVSTVALIDKGSVVVALVLSVFVLNEMLTPAKLLGGALMVAGLIVISHG